MLTVLLATTPWGKQIIRLPDSSRMAATSWRVRSQAYGFASATRVLPQLGAVVALFVHRAAVAQAQRILEQAGTPSPIRAAPSRRSPGANSSDQLRRSLARRLVPARRQALALVGCWLVQRASPPSTSAASSSPAAIRSHARPTMSWGGSGDLGDGGADTGAESEFFGHDRGRVPIAVEASGDPDPADPVEQGGRPAPSVAPGGRDHEPDGPGRVEEVVVARAVDALGRPTMTGVATGAGAQDRVVLSARATVWQRRDAVITGTHRERRRSRQTVARGDRDRKGCVVEKAVPMSRTSRRRSRGHRWVRCGAVVLVFRRSAPPPAAGAVTTGRPRLDRSRTDTATCATDLADGPTEITVAPYNTPDQDHARIDRRGLARRIKVHRERRGPGHTIEPRRSSTR